MSYRNVAILKLIIISSALYLSGCATTPVIHPKDLGIDDATWQSYDKVKQQELLEQYKQLDSANQADDDRVQQLLLAQQQGMAPGMSNAAWSNEAIEVKVSDGTALLPPFTDDDRQPFVPVTFTVMVGACQNADVMKLDGTDKITLRSCYKDKKLRLDPSRYELSKQNGTMTIPYSPLWDQGFTYHGVYTNGYVKLKDANITIKKVRG